MGSHSFFTITESKIIQASTTKVWEIVANAANMPAWNCKCVSTDAVDKPSKTGTRFNAIFQMRSSSIARNNKCEVIKLQTKQSLTTRYSGTAYAAAENYVDETFTLSAKGENRTHITLHVDLSYSGLPLGVKLLAWFLGKFGQRAGRSSLDGIEGCLN